MEDECWNCHGHTCFICDEEQEITYEEVSDEQDIQDQAEAEERKMSDRNYIIFHQGVKTYHVFIDGEFVGHYTTKKEAEMMMKKLGGFR
jgi:hypothetical protein